MFDWKSITLVRRQWERNARQDPYWAILTRPDRRHHRWPKEEFFATGRADVRQHLARLDKLGLVFTRGTALDFGCGVGRLSQALAGEFSKVVGVDISRQMLQLAREDLRGQTNLDFVHNDQPELRIFHDGQFDFIYSIITLQHLPPELAKAYLGEFLRVLRPGGLALFQLVVAKQSRAWFWPPSLVKQAWRALNRLFVFQTGMDMYVVPVIAVEMTVAKAGGVIVASWPDENSGGKFVSRTFVVRRPAE